MGGRREDGGDMDRATWWALASAGRRARGSLVPAGTWRTRQRVGGGGGGHGHGASLGTGISAAD